MNWRTLKEVVKTVGERQTFLVEDLIPTTTTMLIGAPMAGKTYLTTSLARSLTTGTDWLGRTVPEKKIVAFGYNDPSGDHELAERLTALGVDEAAVVLDHVKDQGEPGYWADQAAALAGLGVGVFILDNLMGAIHGDLNTPKDAKIFTDGLDLIAQQGISVIVVHHTQKGKDWALEGLGSRRFQAWARSVMLLERRTGSKRVLQTLGNNQASLKITLEMDVTDTINGYFRVSDITTEADRAPKAERTRNKATLDANSKIHRWVLQHHPMTTVKTKLADKIQAEFGGSEHTHRSKLKAYGLKVDGDRWICDWGCADGSHDDG